MACDQKTLLLISCYADGEAVGDDATRASAHLETCAECRKLVEEWQGSQDLLQWACAFELPDEVVLEAKRTESAHGVVQRRARPQLRWNWRWAAGLATVAIIAAAGYWFVTLPPLMAVGEKVAPAAGQTVRIGSSIRLEIGPGSEVVRLDDRTVRLDKGWVSAKVTHGTGFTVLTKRLAVRDRGTRFWVGTKPGLDTVVVDEGLVDVEIAGIHHKVRAGDLLMSPNYGRTYVARFFAAGADEEEPEVPSPKRTTEFVPATANSLDMEEGIRELAKQFPVVGHSGGYVGGGESDSNNRYWFSITTCRGLRAGLRRHFHEIARSLAGGPVEGEWQVPVACALVDGIESAPSLPGGVYYIRLVAQHGRVVWRVTDAAGHEADFPLGCGVPGSGGGGAMHGSGGSICYRDASSRQVTIHAIDWPGDLKPSLTLKLGSTPLSEVRRRDQPLLREMRDLVSGISGFDRFTSDPCYLDPQRRHRLIVEWNDDAGNELCRLWERAKQGRSGSVILGAVATDSSFVEPRLTARVCLLRFVLLAPDRMPHFELVSDSSSSGARRVLQRGNLVNPHEGSGYSPQSPRGCGSMTLRYGLVRTEADSFVFRFWMTGRPDNFEEAQEANVIWAQGLVRIKKP